MECKALRCDGWRGAACLEFGRRQGGVWGEDAVRDGGRGGGGGRGGCVEKVWEGLEAVGGMGWGLRGSVVAGSGSVWRLFDMVGH